MVVRCLQSKIKAPHVALGVWARAVKEYERGVMSETVDKIIIITINFSLPFVRVVTGVLILRLIGPLREDRVILHLGFGV